MEVENTLTSAGLSRSESKVYCALAGLGQSNVTRLAKETGMYRANVYDTTTKLISKGFISKVEVDQITYFEAEDPSIILDWSSQRVEELKSVMPSLKLAKELNEKNSVACIIEGSSNLYKELFDMLTESKDIIFIGNPEDLSPSYSYILPRLINENKKLESKIKITRIPSNKGKNSNANSLIAISRNKVIIALKGNPIKLIRLNDNGLSSTLFSLFSALTVKILNQVKQ